MAKRAPQNAKSEPKMQPVSHVTPNECIVALNNKQLQKAVVLNCCQNAHEHAARQKLTVNAENGADQSGINWCCFDQRLEVTTSSTFLLMLGVLVDQFASHLGH